MCHKYAEAGAIVVLVGRNAEKGAVLEEKLRQSGADALFVRGDAGDKQSMLDLCETVLSTYGKIDVLVNNAGINVSDKGRVPIYEFLDEDWHAIIQTDLTGVYFCSKQIIKHMIERKSGRIINISSIAGLVPLRNQCVFTAVKAGVINITKAMALELAPYGILVNCICPGSIVSEGTQRIFYSDKERYDRFMSHVPLGRPGKPEEIAGATVFLSSDEITYMTGSVITIDGGWTCGFARDF